MLKSLKDILKVSQVLVPATLTGSGTSSAVEVSDCGSLTFVVNVGAMAFDNSNKLDLKMLESSDGITYNDVVGADMFNPEIAASNIAKSLDSTADQNMSHLVHYNGHKKYVKLNIVETGTVSVPLQVTALQGHLELAPAP